MRDPEISDEELGEIERRWWIAQDQQTRTAATIHRSAADARGLITALRAAREQIDDLEHDLALMMETRQILYEGFTALLLGARGTLAKYDLRMDAAVGPEPVAGEDGQ